MTCLIKTQIGIVALAFAAVLPQTASAKGPGASGAASHISSSVVGHVATSSGANKSNTPSNVGSAPKLNTMSNLKASQFKTTNVGAFTANNFQPSTGSSQYPVWGKSAFSLSNSNLSDVSKASNSSRVINMSNVTAGNLKTSVQGKTPIVAEYHTTSLSIGPIDLPSPGEIADGAVDLAKGAVNVAAGAASVAVAATAPTALVLGYKDIIHGQTETLQSSPTPTQVLDSNRFTQKFQGKLDTTPLMYRNPKDIQSTVVGGVDKNITPNKLGAAAKTSVDTGLLNIPYTAGKLRSTPAGNVDQGLPIPPVMTGGPVANPNTTTQNHSHTPFPFPTTGSGSGSTDSSSATDSTAAADAATATTPADAAKPVASGADLVLEDIKLASPATLVAGPAYTIKFRNQGTEAAAKFQVAVLVGLVGKLTNDAPRAVIEVKSLAAGASGEVTLRLSQSALKLAAADGRPTAFTHLFVAVDLMNAVAETDETNNTAIVERAALETLAVQ